MTAKHVTLTVDRLCPKCLGSGLERDNRAIGRAMRERRERLRLNQLDVARRMDCTQTYVSMLERGERDWGRMVLERYEMALGV